MRKPKPGFTGYQARILSPRHDSYATSTWADRGGQLVAGMDVPVASREASGATGAEVVVAEEVPEESRTPEVQEEALTPEEILEGDQDDPQEVERPKIAPDPDQPTR